MFLDRDGEKEKRKKKMKTMSMFVTVLAVTHGSLPVLAIPVMFLALALDYGALSGVSFLCLAGAATVVVVMAMYRYVKRIDSKMYVGAQQEANRRGRSIRVMSVWVHPDNR